MKINKILHLYKTSNFDSYGGVEKFIHDISRNITPKNNNLRIYIYTFSKKIKRTTIKKIDNYILILVPYKISLLSLPISFRYFFTFFFIKDRFQIFHIHYPFPYGDIFSIFIKGRIIVTYHSDIIKQKISKFLIIPFRNILFNKAKKIIFTSNTYRKFSVIPHKFLFKSEVIYPALNPSDYELTINKNIYSKPFDKYFIFIGGIRQYKGLDLLIETFNQIESNLLIVASGQNVKNIISDKINNSKKNIKLVSNANHKHKNFLLRNSFAFILPSVFKSEAFGYVLLEASFFSKPLITFNLNTGVNEINIHGVTGIVCKNISILSLIEAINYLNKNTHLSINYGRQARKRCIENFSYKKMINSYLEVYKF